MRLTFCFFGKPLLFSGQEIPRRVLELEPSWESCNMKGLPRAIRNNIGLSGDDLDK